MRIVERSAALALAFLLLIAAPAALSAADIPRLAGRVTDLAAILSAEENRALTQMLATYERETTHQIAILTVPSLAGESIDGYAKRVANAWGIGRKDVNNGMLVILAMKERRVRIQLGYGFEAYISNADAAAIIETQMVPSLRRSEYAKGLELGVRELMRQGRAFVAPPTTPRG